MDMSRLTERSTSTGKPLGGIEQRAIDGTDAIADVQYRDMNSWGM